MKSTKVAAKPAAKPIIKVVTPKTAARKPAAVTPPKVATAAEIVAPAKQAPSRKPNAPVTAKITPKVASKTAAKAVGPIVRDSFTMTASDQELLKKCKRDAVTSGRDSTKKSEIVRAALRHFASLSPSTQLMEINGLDPVKTGRPKKR